MQKEIWLPSPTYPAFEASSEGRVKVVPYEGIMPHGGKRIYGGIPSFGVWEPTQGRFIKPFQGKTYKIARIVCDAFNGPPPDGSVCMHLDENSKNNRPENLAWGTQKENLNAVGFASKMRIHFKRLTDDDVRAIRASDDRPSVLARQFGVKPCTITNIRAGRMRTNV